MDLRPDATGAARGVSSDEASTLGGKVKKSSVCVHVARCSHLGAGVTRAHLISRESRALRVARGTPEEADDELERTCTDRRTR